MMEKYAAADTMWVLIGAFMVFFYAAGFCHGRDRFYQS